MTVCLKECFGQIEHMQWYSVLKCLLCLSPSPGHRFTGITGSTGTKGIMDTTTTTDATCSTHTKSTQHVHSASPYTKDHTILHVFAYTKTPTQRDCFAPHMQSNSRLMPHDLGDDQGLLHPLQMASLMPGP